MLIVDFRDPWTQWFETYREKEYNVRKRVERFFEKLVIRNADFVVGTTPSITEYLRSIDRPDVRDDKFQTILNGYDGDDFTGILPLEYDKITLVYTGKIVANLYSAMPFLISLKNVFENDPRLGAQIRVDFLGAFEQPEAIEFIENEYLQENVTVHGYVDHEECIARQLGADILLLMQNSGVTDQFTISGKLFEYLYTLKYIFAIIPEHSLVANILSQSSGYTIVNPQSFDTITANLRHLLSEINKKYDIKRN